MRKKNKKKVVLKVNNLLILLVIISSVFLIYHILLLGPIEVYIRYSIIGVIILLNFIVLHFKKNSTKKLKTLIMFLFIIFNIVASFSINKVYSIIDSINKNKIIYSSSLIALKDSSINSIDDVSKYKIGLISDTLSIDHYVIAKEMIDENKLEKDNEIVSYDDLLVMLRDLYEEKIDLIFISSNYELMFKNTEGFEDIHNQTKVILEKDKTIRKNNVVDTFYNNNSSTKKPFSILLMGVDSEKDGLKKNAYANGDGLILLTFNPETLNLTMMSIPRDTYIPISCRSNTKNKLTHAGWFGTDCMIETIGNTFNIDIDYYVKINFKGLVGIVDALGGVSVDVPKKLCTDDSNRQGELCINKGLQTLNGEEALVLARNRYDLANGDIDRGYNQQLLLRGMLNKITEVRNVNTVLDILQTISYNLDTNLSTNEILSFYNILKDVLSAKKYQNNDFVNIIQIKLKGTGKMIYFKSTKSDLWCYILNDKSIKDAEDEMNINLGLKKTDTYKTFEFSP